METEQSRKRRRYSPQLKAQILAECDVPGASVAKVAMAHGINANLVHGWRKLARQSDTSKRLVQREFVPVTIASAPETPTPDERQWGQVLFLANPIDLTESLAHSALGRRWGSGLNTVRIDDFLAQSTTPQRRSSRWRERRRSWAVGRDCRTT